MNSDNQTQTMTTAGEPEVLVSRFNVNIRKIQIIRETGRQRFYTTWFAVEKTKNKHKTP